MKHDASAFKNAHPGIRDTGKLFLAAFWLSLLFLPFKGLKNAAIFFLVLSAVLFFIKFFSGYKRFIIIPVSKAIDRIRQRLFANPFSVVLSRSLLLLFLIILPFFAGDYFIDIAILSGIYIILALGLNVVVGFAGLLNLGFVAFYAIGAYAYALLNTKYGLGFWPALPFSLLLTTISGFPAGHTRFTFER